MQNHVSTVSFNPDCVTDHANLSIPITKKWMSLWDTSKQPPCVAKTKPKALPAFFRLSNLQWGLPPSLSRIGITIVGSGGSKKRMFYVFGWLVMVQILIGATCRVLVFLLANDDVAECTKARTSLFFICHMFKATLGQYVNVVMSLFSIMSLMVC